MNSPDHESMYFTNLISGDDHELDRSYSEQSEISPVSLEDSPPLPQNLFRAKKSIRGASFTIEEDKLLVSAWLNCSLDPVVGTDQKHSQFWEKIFTYFHQYKETATERTSKSLAHRWSLIQRQTNKYCNYLAQVNGLNQSGLTEQDKLEKTKIMFQSLEKCNFPFEHCWHLLKDQPKWIGRATKDDVKKKKIMSPTPLEVLDTGNVIELDRPLGRKAEKEKRKALGKQSEENLQLRKMKYTLLEESRVQEKEFYRLKAEKMEYDKEKEEKRLHLEDERLRLEAEKLKIVAEKEQSKIRQEDERLRLEAEKMELAKKESDQRIMMMELNAMSEMQRMYFQELQKEIMMRRTHV